MGEGQHQEGTKGATAAVGLVALRLLRFWLVWRLVNDVRVLGWEQPEAKKFVKAATEGGLAARRDAFRQRYPKFEYVDGIRHFRNREGVLVRCDGPLDTPCGDCGGRHCRWERAEFGCVPRK